MRLPQSILAFAVLAAVGSGCGPRFLERGPGTFTGDMEQLVIVTASDAFRFEPATLKVKAGLPVHLKLKNEGQLEHDLTIVGMPGKSIKNDMGSAHGHDVAAGTIVGHAKPQGEATAVFTPTQAGTYGFFCSVPGHKDAGMKGTLEVADKQ